MNYLNRTGIISLSRVQIVALAGLILVPLWVSAADSASVFQWTDDKGQVHFGDKPTHGNARPVVVKPAETIGTDSTQKDNRQRLLQVLADEREQKKRAKEQARIAKAKRQKKCDQLAAGIDELKNGHVVYYRQNEAGEREYISEQGRREMTEKAVTDFDTHCR